MKLLPLTPDDPLVDLEERLAALQALGPMEFDADEREEIDGMLAEMDKLSRDAMRSFTLGSLHSSRG